MMTEQTQIIFMQSRLVRLAAQEWGMTVVNVYREELNGVRSCRG